MKESMLTDSSFEFHCPLFTLVPASRSSPFRLSFRNRYFRILIVVLHPL